MKNPSRNDRAAGRRPGRPEGRDQVAASRQFFAALLWRAFPSPSEHDLAQKAGRVLDVSPRQVQNWLRWEHSAAFHHVAKVMAIAGAEIVLRDPGKDMQ